MWQLYSETRVSLVTHSEHLGRASTRDLAQSSHSPFDYALLTNAQPLVEGLLAQILKHAIRLVACLPFADRHALQPVNQLTLSSQPLPSSLPLIP